MANQRRLTPEQEIEVASRYEAGATAFELAQDYDCSMPTITAAVRRQGVEVRHKGRFAQDTGAEDRMVAAYKAGAKIATIAREHEVQTNTVRAVLTRRGVYVKPYVPWNRGPASSKRRRIFYNEPAFNRLIREMKEEREALVR